MPPTEQNRTEQNIWLGLTASLLAGRAVSLPQLLPGPGHPGQNRDLTALIVYSRNLNYSTYGNEPYENSFVLTYKYIQRLPILPLCARPSNTVHVF